MIKVLAAASLALVAALTFAPPASAQPLPATRLITQPINANNLVTLTGNTRPEAKDPANDHGAVADDLPMEHMVLQLRRPDAREQALQALIDQLHDPRSANYHHWLNAEEFGAQFGLADGDIATVTGWLQQQGFTVNRVYPNKTVIDFSGTAGQVRAAFHTEIHNIVARGAARIANMSDPQIPEALVPAVVGVVSLNNIPPRRMTAPKGNATFAGCGGTCYAMVAADLATIYNVSPVFAGGNTGQGQTIYLLEDTDLYGGTSGGTNSDWATFRSTLGLSGYTATITTVHPGGCADPGVNQSDVEAIIDAEWASAAAPSANIVIASCPDAQTTFGGLTALQNLVNGASPPAIVSNSYGECEASNGNTANQAWVTVYQQGTAEGASIYAATGDGGTAMCDPTQTVATHGIAVNGFASTPYNVAVGGTDFSDTYSGTNGTYWNASNSAGYGSAKSYVPEIPWNDSCGSQLLATFHGFATTYGTSGLCNSTTAQTLGQLTVTAGGGGPSTFSAKPNWQTAVTGLVNDGHRDLPDVSLFAGEGAWGHAYVFCWSDTANGGTGCSGDPSTWNRAGGTSFTAPIWAGFQALLNQKLGGSAQGNPNYIFYQLAGKQYGSVGGGSSACNSSNGNGVFSTCIFYDVTLGDNDVPCKRNAVNCYDPSSSTYGVLSTSTTAYQPAYKATAGWDFATGIGTVNVANLLSNWNLFGIRLAATHDLNADGISDILWRDTSGNLAWWIMNGSQITATGGLYAVPTNWSVVGNRPTYSNHSGSDYFYAGILWLNTTGDVGIWYYPYAAPLAYTFGNVGTQWTVAGMGDFTGATDQNSGGSSYGQAVYGGILWRNTSTGETAIWVTTYNQVVSGFDFGIVSLNWQVAGTGDFNGDGTTDILWRNQVTGDLKIWLIQNGQLSSTVNLGVVDNVWSVVGTGDFNGDGTSDILWRDSAGNLAIWLLANGQFASGSTLAQIPTTWSVAETGDFDGDGKSDILWIDNTGNLGIWFMNGFTLSSAASLGNVGASWQVQGRNAD